MSTPSFETHDDSPHKLRCYWAQGYCQGCGERHERIAHINAGNWLTRLCKNCVSQVVHGSGIAQVPDRQSSPNECETALVNILQKVIQRATVASELVGEIEVELSKLTGTK